MRFVPPGQATCYLFAPLFRDISAGATNGRHHVDFVLGDSILQTPGS